MERYQNAERTVHVPTLHQSRDIQSAEEGTQAEMPLQTLCVSLLILSGIYLY